MRANSNFTMKNKKAELSAKVRWVDVMGDTRYKYLEILYLLQMGIAINEKVTTHCSSTSRLLLHTLLSTIIHSYSHYIHSLSCWRKS